MFKSDLMQRARREALSAHSPVFIVNGVITREKPRKPTITVWPSGEVTLGVPSNAARDVDRRFLPGSAA